MNALNVSERPALPGRFLYGSALVGAVAAGMSTLVYAEQRAGKSRWPSAPAEVIGINSDTVEATVTFPGLGSIEGESYAACIRAVRGGTSAHVRHSTDGVDFPGLARKLIEAGPMLKRMNVNGHSMGGRHAFEVAALARQAKGGEFELGHVALHCSPYDWQDVRNTTTANLVLGMQAVGWQGGPGTKQLVSTVKRLLDGDNWHEARRKANEDARGGCSPRTYPVMLGQFKHAQPLHAQLEQLMPVIGVATTVDYLMPDNPENDHTVWTPSASEKFGELCRKLDIPYRVITVAGMDHANMAMGCAALAGYSS